MALANEGPSKSGDETGFMHGIIGFPLEQELPRRLSILTGVKLQRLSGSIASPQNTPDELRYRVEPGRGYLQIPLLLRWRQPVVRHRLGRREMELYFAPQAGMDFNFGLFGKEDLLSYTVHRDNTLAPDVVVHRSPASFFVNGNVGLALGWGDTEKGFRFELFTAYAFLGGKILDFALAEPFPANRTYTGSNGFQAGLRFTGRLIDWKRTAADRAADRRLRARQKAASRVRRIAGRPAQRSAGAR